MGWTNVPDALVAIGREFYTRGWVLGTSGNLSAVVGREPFRLAITPSGADKGALSPDQILQVDELGQVVAGEGRPSAETLLHLTILRVMGAKAVLHTHSVWSNIISEVYFGQGGILMEGQEMLKGLRGIGSCYEREWLPILENLTDYQLLSLTMESTLGRHPSCHGLLLRRHGLYSWGEDLSEARRHVEILEYLLEVVGRTASITGTTRPTATHVKVPAGIGYGLPGFVSRQNPGQNRGETMATVRIPIENRTLSDPSEVREYLAGIGIDYERWEPSQPVADDAPPEEVLYAYREEIERLKKKGGYVAADVIDVRPDTPGLEAMLEKFNQEHWHDEDEVRFVIQGRGVFHIRPKHGPVVAIEVHAGDLLRVPRATWHWFDLCSERRIRCIRLFQDPSGWKPYYTDSGANRDYEPVCLGPAYVRSLPA